MMTNFLSGILAVIFALTSLCSGVMGFSAEHPVTTEIGIALDGDLSMLTGSVSGDTSGVIAKLLSALSIRLSADASVGQMQVKLNGNPVASLSVQKQEDGWAAVSDLFPTTKLTVKNESLASAIPAEGNSLSMLSGLDLTGVAEVVLGHVGPALEALQGTIGEPEAGSFTVGGVEFTQKTPYNITTKEALELILPAVKEIVSNETISGFAAQLGQDLDPESVQESLEEIQAKDDSELPALSAAVYSNEAGDTATEVVMEKDGEGISFVAVSSGKVITVTLEAMNQMNAVLVIDEESKLYTWTLAFESAGTAMNVNGSVQVQDEGSDLEVALAMPVGETPLELKIKAHNTWEAPVFEASEDLKELALESLEEDEEAATAFNTEIMQSMMTLLLKVSQEFPELMTLMTPASQSPQVEEAPAEEVPAEDAVEEVPAEETPAA